MIVDDSNLKINKLTKQIFFITVQMKLANKNSGSHELDDGTRGRDSRRGRVKTSRETF